MNLRKAATLGVLLSSTALAACQGGGASVSNTVDSVTQAVTNNVNFGAINNQVAALGQAVQGAISTASISSIVNPTDQDRRSAGDIVARIDELAAAWEQHKSSMGTQALQVKMQDPEFRKAEAIVRMLSTDLRSAVNTVATGGRYDPDDFAWMEDSQKLNSRIEQTQNQVFSSATVVATVNETEVNTQTVQGEPTVTLDYEDRSTVETTATQEITTVTRYYTETTTTVVTVITEIVYTTYDVYSDGTRKPTGSKVNRDSADSTTVDVREYTEVIEQTIVDLVVPEPEPEPEPTPEPEPEPAPVFDHPDLGTPTSGLSDNPDDFVDFEFRATDRGTQYLSAINANVAYSRGWTGKGSLIAIADTGYDIDHPDLIGAVKHELDLTGTGINDNVGHGTHVTGIAAGRRNGTGTHGVAFDADVAFAKVTDSTGYSFYRAQQAAAWARDLGSVAFNISANSRKSSTFQNSITQLEPGVFSTNIEFYQDFGYNGVLAYTQDWATALGPEQILVNSAGNQNLDYVAGYGQMATQTDANGNLILGGRMIVVGNYDVNNQIIRGSKAGHVCMNQVGNECQDKYRTSDFYLLAPGTGITNAYNNGGEVGLTGTSMAAPMVTGAIAIVHQMWPHMTGENLVKLLLTTANKDLPGYQEHTHGQGMLDLDRATQPVGVTGIPTTGRTDSPVISMDRITGGAAVGTISADAFVSMEQVMVLDEFERDFYVDLNNSIQIDNRVGSFVESYTMDGAPLNSYAALSNTEYFSQTPVGDDISITLGVNQDLDNDYVLGINYSAYNTEDTVINIGYGLVKETGDFLNNFQAGVMGVGRDHHTQFVSLDANHNLTDGVFVFGNLQMGATDVEASSEFSLVQGYSTLYSTAWNTGVGFRPADGWEFGATFGQPLSVVSGSMNYKVPVGRTMDGQVRYNEGSTSVVSTSTEYNTGMYMKYSNEYMQAKAYGEYRHNVSGQAGVDAVQSGVSLGVKF